MDKIRYLYKLVLNNKKNILLALISFLIISLSFGLGYLVSRDYSVTPIVINCEK